MQKTLIIDFFIILCSVFLYILVILSKIYFNPKHSTSYSKCIPCHKINYYSQIIKLNSTSTTQKFTSPTAMKRNIHDSRECNIIFEKSTNNNYCIFENDLVKCYSNKDVINDNDINLLIANSEIIPFVLETNMSMTNFGFLGCKSISEMVFITNSSYKQTYEYWDQMFPKIRQNYKSYYEENLYYLNFDEIISIVLPLTLPVITVIIKTIKYNRIHRR